MPPTCILVVDDTQSVLNVTHRMLSDAGYEVICAGSGQEAIGIVKRQEFDLVLMDVVMEEMSGPQTARTIRLMRPDIPIMFMTGFPDQLEMLRAETVIQKPFTQDRLVRLVAEVLSHS
jgi:CheY-like chemotaxis protein